EMDAAWRELWACPNVRDELLQILGVLAERLRRRTFTFGDSCARIHADYSLDEIAAAFDVRTARNALRRPQGMGVMSVKQHRTDMFCVTLEKSEDEYTPTTLYNDYPISSRRFHWESQSSTHED